MVQKWYSILLNCSFRVWPVGGAQAASHSATASGPSLGHERLQQPGGVAQSAAGINTHTHTHNG